MGYPSKRSPKHPGQKRQIAHLYIQFVPLSAKTKFKMECVRRRIPMRDAVLQFMAEFVDGSYFAPKRPGPRE